MNALVLVLTGLLGSALSFAQEQEAFQIQKSTPAVKSAVLCALEMEKDGKLEDAIALLHRECKNNPDDHAMHLQLGNLLAKTTRYHEAIDALKKVKTLNPKMIPAYFLLALLYEKAGDVKKAVEEWKNCLKIPGIDQETREIVSKHIAHCTRVLKEKRHKKDRPGDKK